MNDWLRRLFVTIDNKDVDGFVSFLAKDACFRFANAPVVYGRENIAKSVAGFFSSVNELKHKILDIWEHKGTIICEGEVTYCLPDGHSLTFPFVNIFRMKDELIADYRIFVDVSPLPK